MAKHVTAGGSREAVMPDHAEVRRVSLSWGILRPLLTGAVIAVGGLLWAVLRGAYHLSFVATAELLGPIVLIVAFVFPFPGDRDVAPQEKTAGHSEPPCF